MANNKSKLDELLKITQQLSAKELKDEEVTEVIIITLTGMDAVMHRSIAALIPAGTMVTHDKLAYLAAMESSINIIKVKMEANSAGPKDSIKSFLQYSIKDL